MKKQVVFVDIDSTLADTSHRHHLIEGWRDRPKEDTDWDAYSLACADDAVFEGPAQLVRELFPTHVIVMMSNRSELARGATVSWLHRNLIPFNAVELGEAGVVPSDEVKVQRMQRWLAERGYERPALVIDDWPGIAETLKPLGWPTVIVNPMYPPKPPKFDAELGDHIVTTLLGKPEVERVIYVDSGDGKTKVKERDGTVHELGGDSSHWHAEWDDDVLEQAREAFEEAERADPIQRREDVRSFSIGVPLLVSVMLAIFGGLILWWARGWPW